MGNKKQIIFRADGNSETGLGHLFRLFAIVEMVKDDYDYFYYTKSDSIYSVIPNEYNYKLLPEDLNFEDEAEWFSQFFDPEFTIIVADGYRFNSVYQKNIKDKGYKFIYIDDLASEYMYADVVINHSPNVKEADFKAESYTKFALGPDYAVLRPSFLKAAKQSRIINKIDTAFVCFGGADPFDLSLKATKALLNISNFNTIHVVLGGAYNHDGIFQLKNEYPEKIKLYKNLSEKELVDLMQLCNFAIAPASTILYELCCVKMPVLSGFYVDNQKYIYKGLLERNVILKGESFEDYTVLDFEEKIKSILQSNKIEAHLENQQKLFSGSSKVNFLALINRLSISFRKAKMEDLLEVYDWSNDSLVRQNSYDSLEIQIEDHKKWFSKKIEDKNTLFLIALVNNRPAGIVRYEAEANFSVIGILVSKEFRGQSLASEILKESAKLYFKQFNLPVLAYIKKDNKASVKAFEKARYTYFKDEIIKGCISFVYKLEK